MTGPLRFIAAAAAATFGFAGFSVAGRADAAVKPTTPIQHIVYVLQENHSFDNVLGYWCVQTGRCDGATSGLAKSGSTTVKVPLTKAREPVLQVIHNASNQVIAVDGGAMDGFDLNGGCTATAIHPYGCYTQYQPSQIPNLSSLAATYAISDRTFQDDATASWGAHLDMVAGTTDGFLGNIPFIGQSGLLGPGWGCDSGRDSPWLDPATKKYVDEPSCVPKVDGTGPYRPSPVKNVPTIMDRLDAAGLSWKLYTDNPPKTAQRSSDQSGWGWAICPSFAECIDGPQVSNRVVNLQVMADAKAGTLPSFSVVTPSKLDSQHNNDSMAIGDNWIGQVVHSLMSGPEWSSTAIFVSYDDCGCFYDHVPPPAGLGVRVPMVIISPYAKPGYTDSTVASYNSVLAFAEADYGLPPLNAGDRNAYDYMNAFNFAQVPQPSRFVNVTTPVPESELAQIAANPGSPDDPT